ncbi:hypothetical protein BT93_B1051 [Corymbia citriodora subsp. variegata]|nr:hypothetical protein BT93_B1051 [Corymbia citriodora subsp. variegata]
MEKLILSRCNLRHVPDSYVLPPECRPGEEELALLKIIPVIDLGRDRAENIRHSTNHGVSKKLMSDVLEVAEEFFELLIEDKASVYSEDPKRSCRLYTSIEYDREGALLERQSATPLSSCGRTRSTPARYRELAGKYSVEVRKLSMLLLELIGEGLGLEPGFFKGDELNRHGDGNLITVLLQGPVHGLQVLKDGQWLALRPLPDAFVVNIGHALQIISNGKLRSTEHQVTTNRTLARTTVVSFISPSKESMVEPAKEIIKNHNPPLYRSF